VTYVRVTRDQRGYETTFLLHARHPGDRPRVIYWYRTAPGVRVGRPAFDEEIIRSLEEQHPEIEFDWAELMDEARVVMPEPERRPDRRRKPAPRKEPVEATPASTAASSDRDTSAERAVVPSPVTPASLPAAPRNVQEPGAAAPNPLLEQLVGREIAQRLRRRYREIARQLDDSAADQSVRAAWQARAAELNPDAWDTPEAVLRGVQDSDRVLEELRHEIERAAGGAVEGRS
jgi:hypothetical protein